MTRFIRISNPAAGPDEPRRLNAYPGRYLSEREFELLQAYVDDRIGPLLGTLRPGIVQGMEVRGEGVGGQTILHIQPGVAVGTDGALVRLFYPLHQAWGELTALVERELDDKLRDGIYFLTLRAVVEPIDDASTQVAATRTEPDPLRQRRLETVVLPGLQFISANPRLLAMPQDQAANRICVRFLGESPHAICHGATPIALIKVQAQLPGWVEPVAGRYLAIDDAPYRTLLAHHTAVLSRWTASNSSSSAHVSLARLFGVDYLPAAGALPTELVQNPADNLPTLGFDPTDLQVELAPIPASTVAGTLDLELPRGSIDLVHGLGERIRLLLAIPDLDYRPKLLDLPQRDTALEDQLFQRAMAATQAWASWYSQWQLLYRDLTVKQCELYRVTGLLPAPPDAEVYRASLCDIRRRAMDKQEKPSDDDTDPTLPEPYANNLVNPHTYVPYVEWKKKQGEPATPDERLFVQREDMLSDMERLEKELDESYRLLNEMNDYLNLQRQQLDSLTLSFSALAGGVAGDGSGSSMMRWNGAAIFEQKVTAPVVTPT